jgi:hypothetical protein
MRSAYSMTVMTAIMAIAAVATASGTAAQEAPSSQYRGLQTLDIPYANGPIAMDRVPHVWLKLRGARPHRFGMDTGSTGIVVAAEHFIPGPNDVAEGPGRLVYNSSGRIMNGERYTTDVEIQRDEDTPVATARVQVLRVTSITCLEHARDCRAENNPRGVAFMGVGFDRTGAEGIGTRGTERGTPRNPFVSLVSLASGAPVSSVRPGYIATRDGVHLGMSAERTKGFAFIKLAPNAASRPGAPEWSAVPIAVSVDGVIGNGTILVDTGINYMFLSPPEGTGLRRGTRAPDGSRIAVFLPDQRNPQPVFYDFTVGRRGNPMHPERVEVVHDRGVFVNTGRMFLEGFDYLYDAAAGYAGFGWTGRISGGFGGVTPGLVR